MGQKLELKSFKKAPAPLYCEAERKRHAAVQRAKAPQQTPAHHVHVTLPRPLPPPAQRDSQMQVPCAHTLQLPTLLSEDSPTD